MKFKVYRVGNSQCILLEKGIYGDLTNKEIDICDECLSNIVKGKIKKRGRKSEKNNLKAI